MGYALTLIPAIIAAAIIIIVGIYGHGKRKAIYEQYKPYFGAFKAYMFLTFLLLGLISIFFGISTAIFPEDFGIQASLGSSACQMLMGIACISLGILIAYFTDKKAKNDGQSNTIKSMIVAGCGTFWHIELKIIKICCFVWLISYIFGRRNRD